MHENTNPSVYYLLSVVFLIAAVLALPLDVPIASSFHGDNPLPGDLVRLVNLSEVFGYGLSVAAILLTMWTLDPSRRWLMPRIIACAFGAGLMANLVKANVARLRPGKFDFSGGVAATFEGWIPWWTDAWRLMESAHQSFPSGHTATAVGLAIGLGWAYPRGKRLFAVFALMVAMQRISSKAHYLSDTLAGAALALAHCGCCFDDRLYGRLFRAWEARAANPSSGGLEKTVA